MIRIFIVFITLIYAFSSHAKTNISNQIEDVVITDGWVRYPDNTQRPASAYMDITNNSDKDIKLTAASASEISGNVELHQSFVDEKGISRMVSINHMDIPAHSTVNLKPGGIHIMLLDLQKTLSKGDVFDIELLFENHKPIKVPVKVAN